MHAALGDPLRLSIVKLVTLSDRTPTALCTELGVGSNLLAHHLKILEAAGVVERLRSEGDGRRAYVRLTSEAAELLAVRGPAIRASRVLFVCTGNSARSQLAAGLWSNVSEVPSSSAGTHPADAVHPLAIAAGRDAGLDLTATAPRALEVAMTEQALVVTVCDRAQEEIHAFAPSAEILHWWIPDPRRRPTRRVFDDTVRALDARIKVLAPHVSLPPTKARRSA